ncbi:fatty acid hydroxylase, putative [Eimeria tenella]|uniref:Fatty acid hydroxylase, putative n=1 Tax=Eimeria tenella TaxID=5802 RepID=U6KR54_EIMTE|nr:fatty acid hydroxylase, putative [Eimeria tenella]CDJ40421.1 fatty acid hydroxylase, putative [Eimeria tenella]|eukprot:XP_013231171.1 fatty acid hydroxylase, putative [Eimeria tenella]
MSDAAVLQPVPLTPSAGEGLCASAAAAGAAAGAAAAAAAARGCCAACPQHGVLLSRQQLEASAAANASSKLVAYQGLVLDVLGFMHPGGNDLLQPFFGKDITEAFDDVGHSSRALQQLRGLAVGILEEQRERYIAWAGAGCLCSSSSSSSSKASSKKKPAKPAAAAAAHDSTTDNESETSLGSEGSSSKTGGAPQGGPPSPESLIDFSKPLVPQIYFMRHDLYKHCSQTPHCTDKVYTLLPWPQLEPLTKTRWWQVLLLWGPVCGYLAYCSFKTHPLPWSVGMLFFGLFVWTFVEYCMHRFLFHFPEDKLPDSGAVRVVHFLLHSIHHMLPMDPLRLVMPPVLLLLLSLPVFFLFCAIFPQWFVWGAWPGGLCGYLCYDLIHYQTHHCSIADKVPYINTLRVYHMKHHFKYPDLGFGVTSKFWDIVFGTPIDDKKKTPSE